MLKVLGKTQRMVLEFLKENSQQWETTALKTALNMTDDQCLNTLRRLYDRGLVMRVQNGKEFRWTITPESVLS